MKKTVALIVALCALFAPAYAAAHVDVEPSSAPAGKMTGFSFTVGHGCEGAATVGLIVEVPDSAGRYEVEQLAGWKSSSPPGRMIWNGGPLADGELLGFPFRATVYGKKGEAVPLKVIQRCEGGLETAWISVGADDGPGHGNPAPTVTLTSTGAKPEPATAPDVAGPVDGPDVPTASAAPEEPTASAAPEVPTTDAAPASAEEEEGGRSPIVTFAIIALLVAALTFRVVISRRRRSDI